MNILLLHNQEQCMLQSASTRLGVRGCSAVHAVGLRLTRQELAEQPLPDLNHPETLCSCQKYYCAAAVASTPTTTLTMNTMFLMDVTLLA
jgi:hypothetical protein